MIADLEITLEDLFGPFQQQFISKFSREGGVLALRSRHFDFRADQKADHGNELGFALRVQMGLAMLQIDYANHTPAAYQGNRQESFECVLGQVVERFEARILERLQGHCDGLAMLSHPPGDALADFKREAVDNLWMRTLRGSQHQIVAFQHVNEA